ncbi:MAG: hypothetical protein ACPG66_08360 [Flavobacteriales bacterium]
MLWNLTYADPDRWKEVYAISGPPLPWWKRSGSPRMRLLQGPPPVSDLLEETSDIKWANLQRTQAGAILYFRVRLEVYGMPCSNAHTTWSLNGSTPRPVLTLHHPDGPVLLDLNSAPSRGLFRLLEQSFGPQIVSKVHV